MIESKDSRLPYRQFQAEETKRRIAVAARRLFAEHGYAHTSIATIASEAGVAVRTVYAAFGTKQAILAAICEAWLVDAQVGSLIGQAFEERDARRRVAIIATLNRQQWERGSDIVALLEAAAATDASVAKMLSGWHDQRANALSSVITGIENLLAPGIDVSTASAIVRGLSVPQLYLELVDGAGWTADRYEQWLSDLLVRELLDPCARAST